MSLEIVNIIRKKLAVLHSDGLEIYEFMHIHEGPLKISFNGLEQCTTAFLNASIGKFIVDHPEREKDLEYVDIDDKIRAKLDLVLENVRDPKKRDSWESSAGLRLT